MIGFVVSGAKELGGGGRTARRPRCQITMRTGPPKGSKSWRQKKQERDLQKKIEARQSEISTDVDVFEESVWEGNDERARQKFYYFQALKEEKKQHFKRSLALLEKCIAIDPSDTFSWMAMTRVAKEVNPLSVQEVFEKAIAACPTSVHLHHAFGVYLNRIGKRDSSREMFEKAYEIEPGNCYVCQAWGILEQASGNVTRARELFQKAVTDNPNTDVCVALAKLEAEEGNLEQARQIFEQAVSMASNAAKESDAFRAWGMVEEKFGNLAKAEAILQKSFRARPNEETIVVLAKVKMRNGDAPGSLRLIRSIERPKKNWPSVTAMNVWAGLEAKAGNFDEAMNVIKLAISRYSGDSGLYLTWGSLEEKLGNVDTAVEKYRQSVEVRPNSPAFVALGVAEEKLGNLDEARAALNTSIETNPRHGSAYNALGLLEMRNGNVEVASEVFERGVKDCPSASVFHGAALLDLHLGRVDDAREKLERGVRLTREDTSWLWHTLGTLELHRGRPRAAKVMFREAVRRYPQSSVLMVGLALSIAATLPKGAEHEREVRELFKKAVEVDKYHAQAWQCWGVFEHRQGQHLTAAKLFKTGISYNRHHGALWHSWGVLETYNGNIFSARSIFERGDQLCPSHVHLLQAWACMEVRARNIERARELLNQALSVDPTSGPCYCALALLEARHGNMELAREVFDKGVAMAPNHVPLYRTFGDIEFRRQRNYGRARELYEKAIELDPTYAPVFHSYAELEGMLGNLEGLATLQKRMAAIYERGQDEEEEPLNNESAAVQHIQMEQPLSDFEPKTLMESSMEIEEAKVREAEELAARRAEIAEKMRNNPSMLLYEDDSDLDEDEDEEEDDDEDEDEEEYEEYEDDDEDDEDGEDEKNDWEEGDVEFAVEDIPVEDV